MPATRWRMGSCGYWARRSPKPGVQPNGERGMGFRSRLAAAPSTSSSSGRRAFDGQPPLKPRIDQWLHPVLHRRHGEHVLDIASSPTHSPTTHSATTTVTEISTKLFPYFPGLHQRCRRREIVCREQKELKMLVLSSVLELLLQGISISFPAHSRTRPR